MSDYTIKGKYFSGHNCDFLVLQRHNVHFAITTDIKLMCKYNVYLHVMTV